MEKLVPRIINTRVLLIVSLVVLCCLIIGMTLGYLNWLVWQDAE